ncbi:MAG: T9SS C-terminal target domain-containing protein [Saprospirales bacterium]|nr:MAG: T9SS C-terminal target domain-containing protein [Saprospirales bacterium]
MKNPFTTSLHFLFSVSFSFILSINALAQNDVIFTIEDADAAIGDTVCLSITVENFEEIVAMQASVNFNPFLIEFIDVDDISPILGLNENNFGFSQVDSGLFRFNFFNASDPFTLSDGSSMFSLCFRPIGQPGSFAPVNMTDFPIEIEIIKDFLPIDFVVNNGGVQILQSDNFAYFSGSCAADSTLPNGRVFFELFGEIDEFPVTLEYQHLQSPGLAGDSTFSGPVLFELITVPAGLLVYSFSKNGVIFSTDTLEIFNYGSLNPEFDVNPPSCHDSSDGSIELTGVQPDGIYYVNTWGEDGIFETKIEDLANGTYLHFIIDQGGCSYIDTFVLNTTPLEIQSTITDNTCPGDSLGSILVAGSGGTPFSGNTYRYTWEAGQMQTTINTLRSNLPGGIYVLTTSDRNGCSSTDQFEVINENEIDFSPEINNVSCFGSEDGSASFTFSYMHREGSPEFIFTFSDSIANIEIDSNLVFISPLFGGNYSLTVSDTIEGGCTSTFEFEILESDSPLQLEIIEQFDESCEGNNDGRIEVAASGGMADPNGEYTFIWTNGETGAILDSIGPGEYVVRVTDALGCERSTIIEIGTTISPVITELIKQDPTCFDSEDGSIEIEIEPGTGGALSINWSSGDVGAQIENLGAGVYSVVVSDEAGCSDEISTELVAPDSLNLSVIITNESISGAFDGEAQISVSGGTATYTYIFGENNPTSNPLFTGLTAGDYCVIVIDANDCEAEICFTVDVMTSVQDMDEKTIKNLFPNPASDFITLELEGALQAGSSIEIIGIDGRLLSTESVNNNDSQIRISIEGLNDGVYYLRLIEDLNIQYIPFSIIR